MWQEPSPEILNPKCVVDSFSEYVLNTYCVPRLGAEYTTERKDNKIIMCAQSLQ